MYKSDIKLFSCSIIEEKKQIFLHRVMKGHNPENVYMMLPLKKLKGKKIIREQMEVEWFYFFISGTH